jgi:hypothetical protein
MSRACVAAWTSPQTASSSAASRPVPSARPTVACSASIATAAAVSGLAVHAATPLSPCAVPSSCAAVLRRAPAKPVSSRTFAVTALCARTITRSACSRMRSTANRRRVLLTIARSVRQFYRVYKCVGPHHVPCADGDLHSNSVSPDDVKILPLMMMMAICRWHEHCAHSDNSHTCPQRSTTVHTMVSTESKVHQCLAAKSSSEHTYRV